LGTHGENQCGTWSPQYEHYFWQWS
jgi:hypothetical protein